ncbi:MAG TPA: integrin alpha [Candidatus Polarisedimenticolia bacterium]|jgi:hypothetical protein|nr:integrin alpha [Candidatus Polarisedimenticolia bacterium]
MDWTREAAHAIATAEYEFSAVDGGGWSAPNRSQGLRLKADSSGMQVSPRLAGSTPWSLGFELQAVGREGAMTPILPGTVTAAGNRTEIRREALGLSEWYVNLRSGIEQGFTIDRRPLTGGGDSALLLDVAFDGGLEARRDETDGAVLFSDGPSGAVLRYENLAVADADGHPVVAELALLPGILRIAVRDAGHPYPLVIDPTIIVPGWTGLGDQFEEFFGASVAGAGDVNGDGFDDVIVGAYRFDGGFFDEGRVFVFTGSPTGPSPIPAWTAEGHQTGAWFGFSVATAGDVNGDGYADVIIGARLFDNLQVDEGRAYVYLGSSVGLGSVPAWTGEPDQNRAAFGSSVASAGDVNGDGYDDVVVGAPDFDTAFNTDEGRAFLYLGSAAGPSLSPNWSAGSGRFSSAYGFSVASAGDVNGDGYGDVIVGAPLFDNAGFPDEGRVFVYAGSAAGPSLEPVWIADGNKVLAQFGYSVAGAGDLSGDGIGDVIIGAPFDGSGRVLIFYGSTTGLNLVSGFNAKINKSPAEFGASVAGVGDINGDGIGDVAIGAPRVGDQTTPAAGIVRVYYGSRMGVGNPPAFGVTETQPNALLGGSVSSAGDVNGDGLADIIAGASGLDNVPLQAASSGGARVYMGFRTRQTALSNGALHGIRFTD